MAFSKRISKLHSVCFTRMRLVFINARQGGLDVTCMLSLQARERQAQCSQIERLQIMWLDKDNQGPCRQAAGDAPSLLCLGD